MTRCVVIVLDSGDVGTLLKAMSHTETARTLTRRAVAVRESSTAYVALSQTISRGNVTITGHLETSGIHTDVPFPTNRNVFPPAQRGASVACA